jgi:hypothetical protein
MKMILCRIGAALALSFVATACFSPDDQRPGLRLTGESVPIPADWSFTNDHKKIAVEVQTPYLLSHSVTIWCAEMDGELYIGARNPERKRWPGWVDADPDVRLKIGEQLYEVRLMPLDQPERIARLRRAYVTKYELPATPPGKGPPIRYWQVAPRT